MSNTHPVTKVIRWFRRKRSAQHSEGIRIRSLKDLDGYYPWPDLGSSAPARTQIKNPLAVAVRALRIVEYTVASVAEVNPDDRDADGMAFIGFSGALHDLARHGEWDGVGTLLYALEKLMPPLDRARWLAGLDPYTETRLPEHA